MNIVVPVFFFMAGLIAGMSLGRRQQVPSTPPEAQARLEWIIGPVSEKR